MRQLKYFVAELLFAHNNNLKAMPLYHNNSVKAQRHKILKAHVVDTWKFDLIRGIVGKGAAVTKNNLKYENFSPE